MKKYSENAKKRKPANLFMAFFLYLGIKKICRGKFILSLVGMNGNSLLRTAGNWTECYYVTLHCALGPSVQIVHFNCPLVKKIPEIVERCLCCMTSPHVTVANAKQQKVMELESDVFVISSPDPVILSLSLVTRHASLLVWPAVPAMFYIKIFSKNTLT